jgi:hypothetical protein
LIEAAPIVETVKRTAISRFVERLIEQQKTGGFSNESRTSGEKTWWNEDIGLRFQAERTTSRTVPLQWPESALVTETLLVAVCLHPLLTLVLCNLGFPPLLQ